MEAPLERWLDCVQSVTGAPAMGNHELRWERTTGRRRALPPEGSGSYGGSMENLEQETITPKLDLIVLDCPDAMELATFYAKLLRWRLEDGSDADWATLSPPRGGLTPENPDGEATLAFQKIDDYQRPTWPGGTHPQQFHLDFAVPDIEAAEPRVLTLGAAVHEHQPSASGSFRVYVDPAGHPFCLVHGA